jgi:hypothetical protein
MRHAVVAFLLCACGRLHFDPLDHDGGGGDGLSAAHDEDGDGVPDLGDVCPHVADSAQLDSDGDKVGDACDEQPMAPNQTWAFFAPMSDSESLMGTLAQWTKLGDSWRCPAGGPVSGLSIPIALTDADVWLGFDIVSLGVIDRQASFIIGDSATVPFFYGEVYDNGTAPYVAVSHFDGSTYNPIDQMVIGSATPLGPATLHLTARTGAGASFRLISTLGGIERTNMAATVSYTGGASVDMHFGNMSVEVRYIAIIRS